MLSEKKFIEIKSVRKDSELFYVASLNKCLKIIAATLFCSFPDWVTCFVVRHVPQCIIYHV